MESLYNIKEAIIIVTDGVLHITFGEINSKHNSYHDNVIIYIQNDEIIVKGNQIKKIEICGTIDEYDERFKPYCENLIGFKGEICVKRKFVFKKFKFNSFNCVKNSEYGFKYIYIPKFWEPIEYRANNWIIKELKNGPGTN